MKVRQNLYIDRELSDALDALVVRRGGNKSRIVNEALRSWLTRRATAPGACWSNAATISRAATGGRRSIASSPRPTARSISLPGSCPRSARWTTAKR
ncbi:hypothetical protein [Sphingopyxis sp. DBS4]|uniref:hypothetical protein n=1 Tax=Sphingopyxis sp. DBS4 TaxID=2968500 RepID=UPI00214C3E1B|nr:hypothetical protein [Sphingopyxis sp. DBS4]